MMNSSYEVPPDGSANAALQEALRQLAVLNSENTRLRQQMFDSNEKLDDMSMTFRATEMELKYAMKKDAEIDSRIDGTVSQGTVRWETCDINSQKNETSASS